MALAHSNAMNINEVPFLVVTASSTRRAATNQNSHIGFQDTRQREENRQWHSKRQMQPPVSQQVSSEHNQNFISRLTLLLFNCAINLCQ